MAGNTSYKPAIIHVFFDIYVIDLLAYYIRMLLHWSITTREAHSNFRQFDFPRDVSARACFIKENTGKLPIDANLYFVSERAIGPTRSYWMIGLTHITQDNKIWAV